MNSTNMPFFSSPFFSPQTAVKDSFPVSFQTSLSHAMSDLTPGQTIEGIIIDVNKNSLTIALDEENSLSAMLDAPIPLNIGDTASFQVSGFQDSALVLKLLPSSLSSSLTTTIDKALEEAGITKTEETKQLVLSLLDEKLPIDKNTLKILYQHARTYPDTPLKDLVLLMKLNLPITPAAVTQMGLYQSQEHQLTKELMDLKDSLFSILSKDPQSKESKALSNMDSDFTDLNLLLKMWKKHFSLSPDDLKKNGIDSFYDRLEENLKSLKESLFNQTSLEAKKADSQISQIKDNIDFMKQLNSVMLFAQLPFQLKEKNIHSELFVYTKKKESKKNADDVSVLLHLDMDSLGPVDVHITMYQKNVQAKFYLMPDACPLLEQHLPAFTKHLQSKGYYLNYSIKEQTAVHSVINEIQKSCDPHIVIKGNRYAFDQRA